jgi:hypothetical protein
MTLKIRGFKSENKQAKLYKLKNILHSKGHKQQSKETTYKMGKIFVNHTSDNTLTSKIYISKRHTNS